MFIWVFLMLFIKIAPILVAFVCYNYTNYVYIEIFAFVEGKHYLCSMNKTFYNCSFPK